MTIDSSNTVRATNSTRKEFSEPPNIVSTASMIGQPAYDERLFLCPGKNPSETNCRGRGADEDICRPLKNSKNAFVNARINRSIVRIRRFEIWHKIQPELYNKLPKCLAYKPKLYYNNELYVVGLRFVQGVAKLRKVAEVFITDSIYLKLPHIANSKRTIVAK